MPSVAPRFARGYAKEAVIQPPLELYGLNGTYASALYVAAAKDQVLPQTAASISKLADLLAADHKTKEILTDPSLSPADQENVIKVITENVQGDKVFSGFLSTLASNNRLNIIDEILADYQKLHNAGEGLVEATVTSAKELDNSSLKKINAAIAGSKFVGKDKTLKLTNVVDDKIKGGLIVSVGDRTVDLSVASKLVKYNQLLSESI